MFRKLCLALILPSLINFAACDTKDSGVYPANPPKTLLKASETAGKVDSIDKDTDPLFVYSSAPQDVLRLPGEFEKAKELFLGLSEGASTISKFYVDILAAAVTEFETITVFYYPQTERAAMEKALAEAKVDTKNINFVESEIESIWIRDYGPLVVKTIDGGSRIIDFRYHNDRAKDDALPTRLAGELMLPVSRPPLKQEGGNVLSDGSGNCLTTEMTLEKNKDRKYAEADVQNIFKDYLGCQNTLVLPRLKGELTGHVDMYVTFTGPKAALVGQYQVSDDSDNAAITDKAASMLNKAGVKVTRLPMPSNKGGIYRSYTNGLAIGKKVLMPIYRDDNKYEAEALKVFQQAYPGRTIVPIDSTDVIEYNGAVHCVTMTINE